MALAVALCGCAGAQSKRSSAIENIGAVLDDWHDAASKADEQRYFGHMAEDAVFLGTDPAERWTKEQFRAYARPHFSKGRGWTFVPADRHVMLSADKRLAWFDERLENEKYGELRGTGVLRNADGVWKIVHYNLVFTVPNHIAEAVVRTIRSAGAEPSRD